MAEAFYSLVFFSSPVLNTFSLNGNGKTHGCLSGHLRLSCCPLLPLVFLTKPVITAGYLKCTSMSGNVEVFFEKEVLLQVEGPFETMKLRCFIILSVCRDCKWPSSTLPGMEVYLRQPTVMMGFEIPLLSLDYKHVTDKRMKLLSSALCKCHICCSVLQFCTSLENTEFMLSFV